FVTAHNRTPITQCEWWGSFRVSTSQWFVNDDATRGFRSLRPRADSNRRHPLQERETALRRGRALHTTFGISPGVMAVFAEFVLHRLRRGRVIVCQPFVNEGPRECSRSASSQGAHTVELTAPTRAQAGDALPPSTPRPESTMMRKCGAVRGCGTVQPQP